MALFGLETLVLLAIVLALAFDFINGFHDSANAIATVVATRVLTPIQAVLMAGAFNFIGPFVFSLAVANTVGKGIIDTEIVDEPLIIGALTGAIVWNIITWRLGLPSSSSHALIGGLMGAGMAAVGPGSVLWPTRAELVSVLVALAEGAGGGLVAGVFTLGWSRLRVPRALLWPLILGGMAALGYFSYLHTDYSADLAKAIMVNGVFLIFGGVAGAVVWAAGQQPMPLRSLLMFPLPGACITLAAQVLLKIVNLGGLTKALVFMFVSPILGFLMGFLFFTVLQWLWRNTHTGVINIWSKRLQLGSSAFYALTHGTNDAQKTMGIIGVLLLSQGVIGELPGGSLDIPTWVIVSSAAAMGVGTAFGGWRIVRTMASRITELKPHQGFAAETGGGVVLVAMAESGIPVSTTHAISSSIMGVGASRRASAVRWNVGRQMFMAWIMTIPAAAIVSFVTYYVVDFVLARSAG